MTKNEIQALINRSLVADIGYTDQEGKQNIRRVFCTWHKGMGRHLISTNTSSSHVQNLLKKPAACLYFADNESFEGVCLVGEVVVHFEQEYRELLWKDGDERYYQNGINDEDYCIIEFVADAACFYRYDGKGAITKQEIEEFDVDKEFANWLPALN